MQCNSNDPHLKQRVRGKFKGREVHILNYIMNTVFSSFPYQYKSMLNKDFFCIKNLFFFFNLKSKFFKQTQITHRFGALCQPQCDLCKPSSFENPPLHPSPLRALSPAALSSLALSYCSTNEELPIDHCVELCNFFPCQWSCYASAK